MRGAVRPDQASPVHRKPDRQILDRNIVDDLVVGALEEGRIDGRERPVALRGQPGGERDCVLFRNADIEHAIGELLGNLVQARARRHRGGDRHHLLVAGHLGTQRLRVDAGVARRPGGGLGLNARDHVELDHAVIFVRSILRWRVALALLGHDMDQHRADVRIADVLEDLDQCADVMAVDGADVIKTQLLEERAARQPAAGIFLHPAEPAVQRVGHRPG